MPASPHELAGGNHLSGTRVASRLKRPTRRLTGEQPASAPRGRATPSVRSCSKWGLPGQPVAWLPVSSYLTISPLPGARYLMRRAVCFCGTFLKIALTGRYPAFCSAEFGLSSDYRVYSPRLPVLLKPTHLRVTYYWKYVQLIDALNKNALQ